MRLIDATALERKVLEWMPSDPCGREEKEIPFETDIVVSLMMEIEEAPTIDIDRPQGEWLPCDKKGFFLTEVQRRLQKNGRSIWYGFKCSKCGFIYKGNALTESEFCQNCGAKMLTKESPENLSLKADGEVVSKGGVSDGDTD